MMPLLVAHRGAMIEAPENTKAAFDHALAYPVDGIELDVQITSDGIPVIFHDKTLKRINASSKTISDFTFQELNNLDWGIWFSDDYRGERILTLEQVLLSYCLKTHLFIEIKSAPNRNKIQLYDKLPAIVITLVRNIVPAEFITNMYILSFDTNILNLGYDFDPGLNYVINLDAPVVHPEHLGIDMDILHGCCLAYPKLTRKFISFFHSFNKKVMTYSCNNHKSIDRAISIKMDVIMTDDPGSVYEYFSAIVQNQ